MLTELDVRQAVEFESREHPVLSVYLNVDPHRRSPEKYKLALRNLMAQATEALEEDRQRLQRFIELGYNWQGRGLVVFSCAPEEFWWAHSLPVPVEDLVFVSHRPYVHPLAELLDTYQRTGVIHVDQVGARLYLFHLGYLEAVEGYLGEEVRTHRAGGWASSRYQRHEAETARQNLQDAAELAEQFFRDYRVNRLILVGTEPNVARFRELLSHRLRSMVIGTFSVDANAGPKEIQEKAVELAHEQAQAAGQALADQVITLAHKGGNAVLGLPQVLHAVQSGRAQHVVLLQGFSQPAFRDRHTGFVFLSEQEAGEGTELEALPDAVDSVLRRALLQGIGVTVLREHPELEKHGKIGALTRY